MPCTNVVPCFRKIKCAYFTTLSPLCARLHAWRARAGHSCNAVVVVDGLPSACEPSNWFCPVPFVRSPITRRSSLLACPFGLHVFASHSSSVSLRACRSQSVWLGPAFWRWVSPPFLLVGASSACVLPAGFRAVVCPLCHRSPIPVPVICAAKCSAFRPPPVSQVLGIAA